MPRSAEPHCCTVGENDPARIELHPATLLWVVALLDHLAALAVARPGLALTDEQRLFRADTPSARDPARDGGTVEQGGIGDQGAAVRRHARAQLLTTRYPLDSPRPWGESLARDLPVRSTIAWYGSGSMRTAFSSKRKKSSPRRRDRRRLNRNVNSSR